MGMETLVKQLVFSDLSLFSLAQMRSCRDSMKVKYNQEEYPISAVLHLLLLPLVPATHLQKSKASVMDLLDLIEFFSYP